MIGLISFAVLVTAVVLSRVVARRLGGSRSGFITRRGVAETVALLIVAGFSFPIAGLLDFLLSDGFSGLDLVGWAAYAAILAVGILGWNLAGRIRTVAQSRAASLKAANDERTHSRRKVA